MKYVTMLKVTCILLGINTAMGLMSLIFFAITLEPISLVFTLINAGMAFILHRIARKLEADIAEEFVDDFFSAIMGAAKGDISKEEPMTKGLDPE